jgi:hypothetical protein
VIVEACVVLACVVVAFVVVALVVEACVVVVAPPAPVPEPPEPLDTITSLLHACEALSARPMAIATAARFGVMTALGSATEAADS